MKHPLHPIIQRIGRNFPIITNNYQETYVISHELITDFGESYTLIAWKTLNVISDDVDVECLFAVVIDRFEFDSHEMICHQFQHHDQGPISISDKTSHRKIWRSLEAARLVVQIIALLWNFAGISAAVLPRCLSSDRTILNTNLANLRLHEILR